MTLEVLRALITIADFCFNQENCDSCAMKSICLTMPCEWV